MTTTAERVQKLAAERPDLIPLLRRLVVEGDGHCPDDVAEADMDVLCAYGLLVKGYEGPS